MWPAPLLLAHGDSVELRVNDQTALALIIGGGDGTLEGLLWRRADELPVANQFAGLSTVTTVNDFSACCWLNDRKSHPSRVDYAQRHS